MNIYKESHIRNKGVMLLNLDSANKESPVLRIPDGGFSISSKFTEISNAKINIYLGNSPDMLTKADSYTTEIDNNEAHHDEYFTISEYCKVVIESDSNFACDMAIKIVKDFNDEL